MDNHCITIPAARLNTMLLELGRRGGARAMLWSAGQYKRNGHRELLLRSGRMASFMARSVARVLEQGFYPVLVWGGRHRPLETQMRQYLAALSRAGAGQAAALALVSERSTMRAFGWLRDPKALWPIRSLSLPGAGMFKLGVQPLWPLKRGATQQDASGGDEERKTQNETRTKLPARQGPANRLSRLAAFLGEGNLAKGMALLARASQMRVTVVGAGRMGSNLALNLAQAGVGSRGGLFVVDGDVIEEANLDAMLLPTAAVGMPKAEAVAAMAHALGLEAQAVPLVATLSDRVGAEAVASSDLVFSCVDRNAARLGTAALAARYLRPHIDLSGGAAFTERGHAAWGGEVRLVVPGSPGCAACMGDVNWQTAEQQLEVGAEEERNLRQANDWGSERPGSCASILYPVLGAGMLLFWKLLQGKEGESLWLHFNANGRLPVWEDWTRRARTRGCRVCSSRGLRGLGDRNLKRSA